MRPAPSATGSPPPIAKVIGAIVILLVAAALGIPLTSGSGGSDRAGPTSQGGPEAPPFERGSRSAQEEDPGAPAVPRGESIPADPDRQPQNPTQAAPPPSPAVGAGLDDLRRLIAARASGQMVTVTTEIFRVLDDDHEGSRHQRFLIEVGRENGRTLTVKISHNIDLAPRVPARRGDVITVRGEFEFNDLGGVIHWTHHDPARRREGGWIELNGRRYE